MGKTETQARPGLRERKRLKTHRALSEAAAALFERDGFEATTIEAIAETVEVSKRTFFRYFPTKEAAAVAPEMELWEAMLNRVEAAEPGGEATVLERVKDAFFGALDDMPPKWEDRLFACRVLVAHNPPIQAESLRTADEAQREAAKLIAPLVGIDDNDVELRLAVEIGFAAWRTAARIWISARKRDRHGDLVANATRAFEAVEASLTLAPRA